MSHEILLSKKQARRLAVVSQGLHARAPFGRGRNAVIRMIDDIGYVQIDTISVVERAHHHVIATRVPGYQNKFLKDLQVKHRSILEYWAHAAAYIPMEDYRFTIPTQKWFRSGGDGWPKADKRVKQYVCDRIRNEGPLMSRDFEPLKDRRGDGWWDWKPAKLALQRLFFEGELVISHREGFQRVYDLPERVIPSDIDISAPSDHEYADYLIDRYLKAHGVGSAKSIAYLRKGMGKVVSDRLLSRTKSGELTKVKIGGVNSRYYGKADLEAALSTRISKEIKILSPFDNLVIQRNRLSELFDFDYQIECYVPKPKRIHGYFVLPLLMGDKLVGRMDAKADRKKKQLNINSLSLEPKVKEDAFLQKFLPAIGDFAKFNNCTEINVVCDLPYKDVIKQIAF
jgi:uncharacterized protein YcaQ